MTTSLLIFLLIAFAQPVAGSSAPVSAPTSGTSEQPAAAEPAVADISTDRPAWIDEKPKTLSDGTFVTKISVGPYSTVEECQEQLELELPEQVNDYVRRALWRESGEARWVEIPPYLQEKIAAPDAAQRTPYLEKRQHTVGPMYTLHVRLTYDRKVQDELRAMARQSLINSRLRLTGAGATLVLAFLGTMLGYLKLDTATRGNYRWRLKTGAALVSMGLLTAGWRIFNV